MRRPTADDAEPECPATPRAETFAAIDRRVLFVTPEMSDFVKVGGLGLVSSALPRALRKFTDTRVLIPGYREALEAGRGVEIVGDLPGLADVPACKVARMTAADGLVIYVLVCPELYWREGAPYADPHGVAWPDSDIRFARLSLPAAQMAGGLGDVSWTPELLHLNDWPTALAAGYLEWLGIRAPTVLTIHNLAYQGVFAPERLGALGVPESAFSLYGVEFYGSLSYLKAGIYYASHVTTVSQTYAREITHKETGCGLHGLLADRASEGRLTGILNGIEDDWGDAPAADPGEAAAWKQANAEAVRQSFGLAVRRGPLFSIISRLVHQKGVDLAIEAADEIVSRGGQIVVTGRGEAHFEDAVLGLQRRHPGAVGAHIGFDDAQARQIYAGSDFLLMPSRFEPCGLSQMYALKSGALPIAHRTGGLIDTIEDGLTGFLFNTPSRDGLTHAVRRAISTFTVGGHIRAMRRRAMSRDFAWTRSAHRYQAVYQSLG
jgi:starch synthase